MTNRSESLCRKMPGNKERFGGAEFLAFAGEDVLTRPPRDASMWREAAPLMREGSGEPLSERAFRVVDFM